MIPIGIVTVNRNLVATRKQKPPRPSPRKRIFDSAAELFYRKGIRAVGVGTIAARAATPKMGLYRSYPSKDDLVADWLRDHDEKFWKNWDAMSRKYPGAPRKQLQAAFALLTKHVSDPSARGCPMANAAVEITEKDHPARKVIETHKTKLRAHLAQLCLLLGARESARLADELFLLMEGAQVSTILGVRGPARLVSHAAEALIEAHL